MLPNHFEYKDNALHIEDVNVNNIAKQYGTPAYVYSYQSIEDEYKAYANALDASELNYMISYAVKANSNLGILNVLHKLGSSFDLVSAGELQRVIKAGGSAEKCIFSGVGKSNYEIQFALEQNIGCFNVESIAELNNIAKIAGEMNVVAPISIRVNPNIDAKTHPYISTGMKENKFGIDHSEVIELYKNAANMPSINIKGIACHIGSQITDLEPFKDSVHVLMDLIDELKNEGIALEHVDVGGGLGIVYKDETPPSVEAYIQAITSVLKERGCELEVHLEPGRRIIANAGILLSEIMYIKSQGKKKFAIADAAMNDILRPMLYQGWHRVTNVNETNAPVETFDIVGPVCESTDTLAKDRDLALKANDYIAMFSAGAYCMSMSSTYNSRSRPVEILVKGNEVDVIRERDTIEDVCVNEKLSKF